MAERLKSYFYFDDEIMEQAKAAVSEGRLLDLTSDSVFKSFFSREEEESAYCRRRLLSAVLGREVTDTTVLNSEIAPEFIAGKAPRLDIRCRLADGSEIDVEMQKSNRSDDQTKRTVYYASKLMAGCLKSGKKYSEIPEVHQILFTNFRMTKDKRLHHTNIFKEQKDNFTLHEDFQIHFVELPKLKEILKKRPETLSELEFWAILILTGTEPSARHFLSQFNDHKEDMTMATSLLNKISQDEIEWACKLSEERFIRDMDSLYATIEEKQEAVRIKEENIKKQTESVQRQAEHVQKQVEYVQKQAEYVKSREEELRVREANILKSEEELRNSKERLLNTARVLKQAGVSVDLIAQSTGLSPEDIRSL